MENTRNFLIVVAATITSYMFIAFIAYLLTDMTYKEACTSTGVVFTMVMIGWIFPVVVGIDLDSQN